MWRPPSSSEQHTLQRLKFTSTCMLVHLCIVHYSFYNIRQVQYVPRHLTDDFIVSTGILLDDTAGCVLQPKAHSNASHVLAYACSRRHVLEAYTLTKLLLGGGTQHNDGWQIYHQLSSQPCGEERVVNFQRCTDRRLTCPLQPPTFSQDIFFQSEIPGNSTRTCAK